MAETILVAGATGYVGGRLVPMLLSAGHKVRVYARNPAKLADRPWARHENLEIATGDIFEPDRLNAAIQGCTIVYYLIHSMTDPGDFSESDRRAAYNMVEALKCSAVKRIIYLSGITPHDIKVSPHLRSRDEVRRILSLGSVPITTLQASQIIGVGSASFEMLRYLADRLPFLIAPTWVDTKTQPISMSNVLVYLIEVMEHPETAGQTYDIGGPDIISYRDLLNIYTETASLPRRRILTFPGFPLWLVAAIIGLISPIPRPLAKALTEGMRNQVICKDNRILTIIPQNLLSVRQAVGRALGKTHRHEVDTSWLDAGMPAVPEWALTGDPAYTGGTLYSDSFRVLLNTSPDNIWPYLEKIGGETGWYSTSFLWKARGLMDRLVGGPGVQRGRRSQTGLRLGDCLDFYRVMEIRPQQRLLLLAEMRLPGEGLLDLSLIPAESGHIYLYINLYYRPHGILGHLYWLGVTPFHSLAFKGMLRAIVKEAGVPIIAKPERTTALPIQRPEASPKPADQKKRNNESNNVG